MLRIVKFWRNSELVSLRYAGLKFELAWIFWISWMELLKSEMNLKVLEEQELENQGVW